MPTKKLSKKINSVEQLIFSKIEYKNRERIFVYTCSYLTRGLLELKFPNISSVELDYLFSNYSSSYTNSESITLQHIDYENYLRLRVDMMSDNHIRNENSSLSSVAINLLKYNDPKYANYNFLINKVNSPKIRFFCEYVFLDETERNTFASSKLEYIINIPRQINTDVHNDEFFSSEIDLLNPTKELFWFFRPKTQVVGINRYAFKNPSLYNKSDIFDSTRIVEDIKIFLQDFEIVNFEKYGEKFYSTVLKNKYLIEDIFDGYYYYSFSLFPRESQPSGNVNLSNIKGKLLNARLNTQFLSKHFNTEINKNNIGIEFIIINNNYNLIKIDKGKLTSVFY